MNFKKGELFTMENLVVSVVFNIGERADDVPLAEIQLSLELLQVSSVLVTDVNCTVKVFKRQEGIEADPPGEAPAGAPPGKAPAAAASSPPPTPPPPFHYPPKEPLASPHPPPPPKRFPPPPNPPPEQLQCDSSFNSPTVGRCRLTA